MSLSFINKEDRESMENLTESALMDDLNHHLLKQKNGAHHSWSLSDTVKRGKHKVRLPMTTFNHIAKEVLDLEKSRYFYVEILGFEVIPRPPFEAPGYWLYGYGLSLHLVQTIVPKDRRILKGARLRHFSSALPRVDHMAFLTEDLSVVREILDKEKVYYKADSPADGISQVFLFDPDGNVIEISNCAPIIGEVTCQTTTNIKTCFNNAVKPTTTETTVSFNQTKLSPSSPSSVTLFAGPEDEVEQSQLQLQLSTHDNGDVGSETVSDK